MFKIIINPQNILLTPIFILACECNSDGSVNELCDDNGRCTCNEHVVGDKCDACAVGYGVFADCDHCVATYHGYPNCIGKYDVLIKSQL